MHVSNGHVTCRPVILGAFPGDNAPVKISSSRSEVPGVEIRPFGFCRGLIQKSIPCIFLEYCSNALVYDTWHSATSVPDISGVICRVTMAPRSKDCVVEQGPTLQRRKAVYSSGNLGLGLVLRSGLRSVSVKIAGIHLEQWSLPDPLTL